MFVIQADKSKLTIIEDEILVNNAVDVYPIRFDFSSEWDGFVKIAIFYNDLDETKRYQKLLSDSNETTIPPEVLTDVGGIVYVGVCGDNAASQHLPTRIIGLGQVLQGICGDTMDSSDPSPDIYQQLLAELADIRSLIQSGVLQGPAGPRGPRGEQGIPGEKGADGTMTEQATKDLVIAVLKDIVSANPTVLKYENDIIKIRFSVKE